MHQPTFPTFRSTSLPNPTRQNRASQLSLQLKRDSGFLAGEGPITPPMSPGPSEEDDGSISVDTEPRYSGHRHEIPIDIEARLYSEAGPRRESRNRSSDERMDIDPVRHASSSPRPPARHLEDEPTHVDKGSLKLTDFEVKGTLGKHMTSPPSLAASELTETFRNRNLWSRASCSAAVVVLPINTPKLFRDEGPQEDRGCSTETSRARQCRTLHPITGATSFYCRSLRNFPRQPQYLHVTLLRTRWGVIYSPPTCAAFHTGCHPLLSRYDHSGIEIPSLFQHYLSRSQA